MKMNNFLTTLFLICLLNSCIFNKNINEKAKNNSEVAESTSIQVDSEGLSLISAVIKTVHGNIEFKFYPESAPVNVARVIELITTNFYDGLAFHRVEKDFVIQTGDPTSNGMGGSGRKLPAEFNDKKHILGTVGMARFPNDKNSADSQFYITLKEAPELDGNYTIIGQVIKGQDVLTKINKGDKIISLIIN